MKMRYFFAPCSKLAEMYFEKKVRLRLEFLRIKHDFFMMNTNPVGEYRSAMDHSSFKGRNL